MRAFISALGGTLVATALFLLMSGMISGTADVERESDEMLNLDFIQLDLDEVENIRRRVPPPEPEVTAARPPMPRPVLEPLVSKIPTLPDADLAAILAGGVEVASPLENARFDGSLFSGDLSEDGDIVPLLRIDPIFPTAAMMRRISGWVDLDYVVMPDGSVANARVVRSSPPGYFDAAALAAIAQWKFKPRIVNGRAVPRGVEQRMNFNIL